MQFCAPAAATYLSERSRYCCFAPASVIAHIEMDLPSGSRSCGAVRLGCAAAAAGTPAPKSERLTGGAVAAPLLACSAPDAMASPKVKGPSEASPLVSSAGGGGGGAAVASRLGLRSASAKERWSPL